MKSLISLLVGGVIGLVLGFSGHVQTVSFVGFWLGGMWLLLIALPISLYVAWRRQHNVTEVVLLGLGASAGFLPGAIIETRHLPLSEAWFPTIIVAAFTLCIGPLLLALGRRISKQAHHAAA